MPSTVTPDTLSDGGSSAGASSLSWSHTINAGLTNPFLVVNVTTGTGVAVNVSGVAWDDGGANLALSNAVRAAETAGNCKAEIWGVAAPVAGTKTIKVTLPSSVEVTAGAISAQLVNQSAPYDAATTPATGAGAPSSALNVTSSANGLAIDCFVQNGGVTLGVLAGQTIIHNDNIGAGQHVGISSHKDGAAGTVTMTITPTGPGTQTWVHIGVSLVFDNGIPATPPPIWNPRVAPQQRAA